jgi:hypothetical protein
MIFEIEDKDETYLQLNAMMPFKNMIIEDYNKLQSKSSLSENEQKQLAELEQQIEKFRYLESYETLKNEKEIHDDLKNNNDMLKLEVEKLQAELNLIRRNNNSKL